MPLTISLTTEAQTVLDGLAVQDMRKYRKVLKTLRLMAENVRHPELHTHEYLSLKEPQNEKVFEAYVENNTPAAYRIFWYYEPASQEIMVFAIVPHP